MEIFYHKNFVSGYKELRLNERLRVDKAIGIFSRNFMDARLRSHKLVGLLDGRYAFSVGGDLRVIYYELDDYKVVVFERVGKHSKVY
jgi:mRNA-degrading endonuclease YafQ of YafQ-DinJ toxin-antitoxin module